MLLGHKAHASKIIAIEVNVASNHANRFLQNDGMALKAAKRIRVTAMIEVPSARANSGDEAENQDGSEEVEAGEGGCGRSDG